MNELVFLRCNCCSCLVVAATPPDKLRCPQCVADNCMRHTYPTFVTLTPEQFRDEVPVFFEVETEREKKYGL